MKKVFAILGYPLAFGSAFILFLVDMYSLYLLNLMHGIFWAFVAFFMVPAQIFVPFIVGTWPIAILFTISTFIGFGLVAASE